MPESNKLNTLTWLVSGRVQGVGFRFFTQKAARKLGLTGTVRNLPDGRVEVVAQGTSNPLSSLYSAIHEGPGFARVTEITEIETADPDREFREFKVTF